MITTRLSIVIPAFNYAGTLKRAVDSVLSQLSHHELIVIDDGSTDKTRQVLAELQIQNPGTFRSIFKNNGGPASVRNRGLLEAANNYLIFLDADDELAPGAIAAIEGHISMNPQCRMIIGGYTTVYPNGKRRIHTPAKLQGTAIEIVRDYLLRKRISLSNGACVMHREIFERGGYPEKFRSVEDIPVFVQALANYPCTVLQQSLAFIHKHDDSLRRQFNHANSVGLALVDEVFSPSRLGYIFKQLKPAFYVQRCLSLSRSAYQGGDSASAKYYFRLALKRDWRVLLKSGYAIKVLCSYLRH